MAGATSSTAVKIVRCCYGLPALPRLSKRAHARLLNQNLREDAETSIQAASTSRRKFASYLNGSERL